MRKLLIFLSFVFEKGIYKNGGLPLIFILFSLNAKTQDALIIDSISTIINNENPVRTIAKTDFTKLHYYKAVNNRVNFGLSGREYHYIILKVSPSATLPDRFLSIDNTSLDTLAIYKIFRNGSYDLLYLGGELVKYNTGRNYVWHSAELQLSTVPSYYLIAAKAPEKNINIQYEIYPQEILQEKYEKYERFIFFYIGVASMIAAIILIAFVLFKKKVFGLYLGYIFCMSIWIVAHYGRLFPFVYPNLPAINPVIKPVSCLFSGIFLLLVLRNVFIQNLFSLRWLPRLLRGTQYTLMVLTALMFLLLINDLNTIIKAFLIAIWHIGVLFSIAIIVCTPLRFIRSGALAKIFSCAMLVICAMVIIQLFANSGFIKSYFINEHGMAFGSLLENSIMAFGLFYGLLEERKNKEMQVLALEEEQKETLKKLITVQDNERKRIAADLHDNIGPLLAALKINFNRIINNKEEKNGLAAKTEAIIDDSIMEIRDIAHNLMPKGITSKGLINALKDYFESMESVYNKCIIFNHDVQSIFQPELQINIYRIICELVLNAAKHSNAGKINVSLAAGEKVIAVNIFDDGQGFPPDKQKKSLGLQSAESRVHYLKGKFCLKSVQNKGTTINIEVPL